MFGQDSQTGHTVPLETVPTDLTHTHTLTEDCPVISGLLHNVFHRVKAHFGLLPQVDVDKFGGPTESQCSL